MDRLIIPSCLLALLCCPPAESQEWTRFRGPNGSGVSATPLPAVWQQAHVRWKVALPGQGHASPVIWGTRVFLLSADPSTAAQIVSAVDANDGTPLWQQTFATPSYPIHARNTFASSSPAVDAERVYVAWATPQETQLTALDHTGQVVWQTPLGGYTSQHGFGGSPIVHDEYVILSLSAEEADKPVDSTQPPSPGSRVVAVQRATGELAWTTPRTTEVASYSVPCIYRSPQGDDELILCDKAHGIFSLNPSTGAQNWSLKVFDKRTVSSPVVADGLILGSTGSGGGGSYVVAVDATGPQPRVAYEVHKQAPYVPTLVANNGLAFLWSDRGIVTCLRTVDGTQVWQERIGGNFSGSPVIAGEHLFCVDDDGLVVILSASEQFALLSKYPLEEICRSTPAIANGRMYVRTLSHLTAIGGSAP